MSMLKEESSFKCFGGFQKVFTCQSQELKNEKRFCVYLPPKAILSQPCPVLYWLMGATCDDQEFILKSGMQRAASAKNMIVISVTPVPIPLTLKVDVTDVHNVSQFGFYIDCDQPPFNKHYHMHSFIIKELVPLIDSNFPTILEKRAISGHSIGGQGSLMLGLTHPDIFHSISTMSAMCHPTNIPMGRKVFEMYLGNDQEKWKMYDPTCLLQNYKGPHRSILFDMGGEDELQDLLQTHAFVQNALNKNISLTYRVHSGYSHGQEFLATFVEDHILHHYAQFYK